MPSQYKQFLYSHNGMLTLIEGAFRTGVNGVVVADSVVGTGFVSSSTLAVSRPGAGTGVYQVFLADRFQRLLAFSAFGIAPPSSAETLDGGGIVVGTVYRIIVASSGTNWGTLGLPTGITPSTGIDFVATSGASNMPASSVALVGNGRVARVGTCNFARVEVLNGYNMEMNPTTATINDSGGGFGNIPVGSVVNFQTVVGTSGAPSAPTSGTLIRFHMLLRKSSVLGQGETPSNY